MTSAWLKPEKLLFSAAASVCLVFSPVSQECVGRNAVDNRTNIIIRDQLPVSKTANRYVSLQGNTVSASDSSVVQSAVKDSLVSIGADSELNADKPFNKINYIALWLMGDENVSDFKHRMIDFGNHNLPSFLNKLYRSQIERIYTYPIIIFFILFTLLLLSNVTLVLVIMYFSNKEKNRRERYIAIYRKSYEEIFRSYLFGEIDWDRALLKMKKKKKRLNRKIMTDVILVFKENLRGEMDGRISQMFIKLGLQKDSLRLLKSWFYYRKIEGMKALTNLDPETAREIIPEYLNNSHFQVRTEAQVSYVRLYPGQPFEFLKTLTTPFPRWTQLSAFYIFRLYQIPVPAFIDYIESGVPTVRSFILQMIVFFQQLENASAIYKLLDSPDEMTRFLAIRAVNDLRLYEGRRKIREMYRSETFNNKLEIIKAIKNIGDEEDFDFLESVIITGIVSLKIEACRSLYYVNNEGEKRLSVLSQNGDLKIDRYLAHVTDPRN